MLLIERKMPKSCIDCVCNNDDYWCNMTGDELDYDIAWTGRMPNCPLKEGERKTGMWIIEPYDVQNDIFVHRCGVCMRVAMLGGNSTRFHYCPLCGSFMEGKQP